MVPAGSKGRHAEYVTGTVRQAREKAMSATAGMHHDDYFIPEAWPHGLRELRFRLPGSSGKRGNFQFWFCCDSDNANQYQGDIKVGDIAGRHFGAFVCDEKDKDYVDIIRMGALWYDDAGLKYYFAGGILYQNTFTFLYYTKNHGLQRYYGDQSQLRKEAHDNGEAPVDPQVLINIHCAVNQASEVAAQAKRKPKRAVASQDVDTTPNQTRISNRKSTPRSSDSHTSKADAKEMSAAVSSAVASAMSPVTEVLRSLQAALPGQQKDVHAEKAARQQKQQLQLQVAVPETKNKGMYVHLRPSSTST